MKILIILLLVFTLAVSLFINNYTQDDEIVENKENTYPNRPSGTVTITQEVKEYLDKTAIEGKVIDKLKNEKHQEVKE